MVTRTFAAMTTGEKVRNALALFALASSTVVWTGCGAMAVGAGAAVGYKLTESAIGGGTSGGGSGRSEIPSSRWNSTPDRFIENVRVVWMNGSQDKGTLFAYNATEGMSFVGSRGSSLNCHWSQILVVKTFEGGWPGGDALKLMVNGVGDVYFEIHKSFNVTEFGDYIVARSGAKRLPYP